MPGLRLVSGPTEEPLTVEEVKGHLRLHDLNASEEPDLIRKIKAARAWVERRTSLALLSQVWAYWFDAFPSVYYIDIPKAPIISIDSVTSYDEGNAATVFSPLLYATDVVRSRVLLNAVEEWPYDVRRHHSGVIQFTAGFGTAPENVPDDLREAVAEMTGYFFYDREGLDPVPQKVLDIIAAHEMVSA